MTENDIIDFVSALPGTAAMTADEAGGAPEVAWGDTFFFYDPDDDPAARRLPFATIVTKDYAGFDTASDLDRPGIFRLNIAVGRTTFTELTGYPPAAHPEHHDTIDYTATDRILPHPVYAPQSWIAILNPAAVTTPQARALLQQAHTQAAKRHHRRPAGS
ncbi:DUF6194 family protein [Sphaerisporangium aureirubrum]|uniref:DUF6194 family protein n=1 Tax=Sphaerisporangium aureirubrum TaxID=1544736 RepID=A0ABW1ND96_9ACTN